MTDYIPEHWRPVTAADQLNGASPDDEWAMVEVFGHRRHFGRIAEIERFGAKMLRVDVPAAEQGLFYTFFYPGSSLFGITPLTEAAAREGAARDRPIPYHPRARLDAPDDRGDDEADDNDRPF